MREIHRTFPLLPCCLGFLVTSGRLVWPLQIPFLDAWFFGFPYLFTRNRLCFYFTASRCCYRGDFLLDRERIRVVLARSNPGYIIECCSSSNICDAPAISAAHGLQGPRAARAELGACLSNVGRHVTAPNCNQTRAPSGGDWRGAVPLL